MSDWIIPEKYILEVMQNYKSLVRCKNCGYWRPLTGNADGYGVCRADNQVQTSRPDWFCADGVRKNETDRR